jgi:hypothetical protein
VARALNEVALRTFKQGKKAYQIQRRYLRTRIPIGTMDVREYTDRLDDINSWLKYFPVETNTIVGDESFPKPMGKEELMDLLHFAQPIEWNIRALQQANEGFFDSLEDMQLAYSLYQDADKLVAQVEKLNLAKKPNQDDGNNHGKGNRNSRKRGKRTGGNRDENAQENKTSNKKQCTPKHKESDAEKCPHCGRVHKKPWSECWSLPANKDKKPEWFVLNGKSQQQTSSHIREGENTLIKTSLLQKLVQKAAKQTKRRPVIVDEDEEDDRPAKKPSKKAAGKKKK